MKAPFPAQAKNPEMDWVCNADPQRLDQFYIKFLGRGGDAVLSDEVKWLAITHKSFDQGRRGFNDRLAFFGEPPDPFPISQTQVSKMLTLPKGRRILNLQASLALLHSPIATQTQTPADPADKRVPFTHPALDGLQNLTDVSMAEVLSKKRLAGLAAQLGMPDVLRWKPRMVSAAGSGGWWRAC
jgi:large subunit ribosomal protein L15